MAMRGLCFRVLHDIALSERRNVDRRDRGYLISLTRRSPGATGQQIMRAAGAIATALAVTLLEVR